IPRDEFNARLLKTFEALESAVADGKIRMYGAATWNGFRNEPGAKDYLSLEETVAVAEKAGGREHHFKVIQLPLNLGMAEALSLSNQEMRGKKMTTLEAAQALDITVMCSASVLQGQLTRNLPGLFREAFPGLKTDAQLALQFVRSTPGVTTALVGMKQAAHIDENLQTVKVPPASWEQYSKLFQS
ncbi:MAG: aldo/keto reductase, partial [Deltaproteobacteria bacterium]|nr:aldo/keto reductase [Deltaproteobacteria bacterium]